MTPEQAAALRAPFPPEAIGKLPKAGIKLDYVGHAGVTDRLLAVDPEWTWEPAAVNEFGVPLITAGGLWIRLTVCGVTRYGWGDGPDIKQMISDAIRNAAMRFGVALDLWSKEDLHAVQNAEPVSPSSVVGASTATARPGSATSPASSESAGAGLSSAASNDSPATSKARRARILAKNVELNAIPGVSIADERVKWQLPIVDKSDDKQLDLWEEMQRDIEARLEAPFVKADA